MLTARPRHRPRHADTSSPLGLLIWTVVVSGCLSGLLAVRGDQFDPWLILHPHRLVDWADSHGATSAAFGSVRILGIAAAGYLLAVTFTGLVVRLSGATRAIALVDALTPRFARHLVAAGVSASLYLTVTPAGASNQPTVQVTGPPSSIAAGPRYVDVAPPPERPPSLPPPPGTSGPSPPRLPLPTENERLTPTWTTKPGDSFWSIAESILTAAWSKVPLDPEVGTYWQSLMALNRGRLADPDNADLIYPGQVFLIPPPPDRGGDGAQASG